MMFGESISTCLKKYFVFEGRASKSEYWWFQLIVTPSYIISTIGESIAISYFFLGITIITFIPAIAVGARRLHDINKSGFYLLLSFIPFIGGLIVLFFLVSDGTKGRNQYGDNPLKKTIKKKKRKN